MSFLFMYSLRSSSFSGHALSGSSSDHCGYASYANFLTVSLRDVDLRLAEHLHDARTDDEAHDEREDREHDHDLEQRHAALGSR